MRIVVYGIGAVGGTIAARLAMTGNDVVGIARGKMLDAIKANGGLKFTSAQGVETAKFNCYAGPGEFELRPDDAILLTVKSQDTDGAIEQLRAAGVCEQPVVCAQNGVANERTSLRYFPNTYGMTIMMPAQYSTPGEVEAFGQPKFGLFDVGRYPTGEDNFTREFSSIVAAAGFDCLSDPDVMKNKYGKLLINVGKVVGAAFGTDTRHGQRYEAARKEAEAVYTAAGIGFGDVDYNIPRRELMKTVSIPGVDRSGSSSLQSLLRGAGSIETDYLNGEIVLLGRLHGVPTPVNAALCQVAWRMIQDGIKPGAFPEADFEAMLERREA